jgi:hypothetical protein
MEQRRLRLGDILDDYCPRERRLTNHAVVAMIEEDVKQTRCTTCDAEHAYKGGKLPRRRKKDTASALYTEVLAGHLAPDAIPVVPDLDPEALEAAVAPVVPATPIAVAVPPAVTAAPAQEDAHADADEHHEAENEEPPQVEEGPVHRPLIRAQLPRIEGQKEERRLPEFTIRQRAGGNGHFRGGMKAHRPGGHGGNAPGGNSNRGHGAPRFAGSRSAGPGGGRNQAGGRGAGGGFRSGGGRKRSR